MIANIMTIFRQLFVAVVRLGGDDDDDNGVNEGRGGYN